ncbi:hypothetical protein MRX96_020767 [Rhipicephalus microplus]
MYNTQSGTRSPVTVIQSAETPRAYMVATEDVRQLQHTREHITLTPVLPENHVTPLSTIPDNGTSVPSDLYRTPPEPMKTSTTTKIPRTIVLTLLFYKKKEKMGDVM